MEALRQPFQGVGNIIRFNWQYFFASLLIVIILFVLRNYLEGLPANGALVIAVAVILLNLVSLAVSFYIYDVSMLYKLTWLDKLTVGNQIININAGFDETSLLLKNKYANSTLTTLDFYDPTRHTEVSIKRARKAYPPFPNTQKTGTSHLPLQNNSVDNVFMILSAHEIRNAEERLTFLKEVYRVLRPTGQAIITEHLRDTANFLAYNIGYFHFHTRGSWLKTIDAAGFMVAEEIKITPFISTFILNKNGAAS